jgi:hypothetical protein
MLKYFFILIVAVLINPNIHGQEIEVVTSLSTSSDLKFQSSHGIGLKIFKELNKKYLIGVAGHYNFNSGTFDRIDQDDASFNYYYIRITSCKVKRTSLRISLQRFLINNDYVSLALGPELNYNYLWGNCHSDLIVPPEYSHQESFYRYDPVNAFGLSLVSMVDVKNVLVPKLSLCLTIRPEVINDRHVLRGISDDGLRGIKRFTEFQIGMKYKIGK